MLPFNIFNKELAIVASSLLLSLFLSFFTIFYYLEELLYLLFLPYFLFLKTNNLVVTSFQTLLMIQFVPVLTGLLFTGLMSILTVSNFVTLTVRLRFGTKLFYLYCSIAISLAIFLFWIVPKLYSNFIALFYFLLPSNYYAYFYVLDLTTDGWVGTVQVFIVVILASFLFFLSVGYYLLFRVYSVSLVTRVVPVFCFMIFSSLLLPPDPLLHALLILISSIILEFILVYLSFRNSYALNLY